MAIKSLAQTPTACNYIGCYGLSCRGNHGRAQSETLYCGPPIQSAQRIVREREREQLERAE